MKLIFYFDYCSEVFCTCLDTVNEVVFVVFNLLSNSVVKNSDINSSSPN